jgi:hypothetical protein
MTWREAARWCRWRSGTRPLLIVAPHAARRALPAPDPHRGTKVNDLHTGSVAEALAGALDASLLINTGLDRNVLDLNRTSQVNAGATWFLALLEHLVEHVLSQHEVAEVLFIHGWNVVQARCDIGVGARLTSEEQASEKAGQLTVSPSYLHHRLEAFRHLCSQVGVEAIYGERYPASHPNNLLQIFRHHRTEILPNEQCALRRRATAGRIEAVQLELGAPLRWPGPLRDHFIEAVRRAFAERPIASRRPTVRLAADAALPAALQVADPRAGIGISASVSGAAGGPVQGRLLLLTGGRHVGLFVGQGKDAGALAHGGFRFETLAGGLRMSFDGHVLETADGLAYTELERAFDGSQLTRAIADLRFKALAGETFGCVDGVVALGQRRWSIDALGFTGAAALSRGSGAQGSHVALAATWNDGVGVRIRAPGDRVPFTAQRFAGGRVEETPLAALRVDLAEDHCTPRRILAVSTWSGGRLVAEPLTHAAVRRRLGPARMARVTFGLARFRDAAGGAGIGFYEYGCELPRLGAARL